MVIVKAVVPVALTSVSPGKRLFKAAWMLATMVAVLLATLMAAVVWPLNSNWKLPPVSEVDAGAECQESRLRRGL